MGRLFGTNGVRGLVGQEMTPELALRLGRSLASHLNAGARVAVGMDARTSSPLLMDALTAGLRASGAQPVRLGVAPTPAIQFYVKTHDDISAGAVITASHNPPEFNGIKFIAGDGTEMAAEEEAKVEDIYFGSSWRQAPWDEVGLVEDDGDANEAYIQAIVSAVDAKAIANAKLKVVVDAAGGPGVLTAPVVLERLGCQVVRLNGELDGAFSGRPSEPVEKNLSRLMDLVIKEEAHLGVAQDGDADRCVFIDEAGEFVSGDKSFAILAKSELAGKKGATLCTPVSTSNLVIEVAQAAGARIVTTAVGSPIVARRMIEEKAAFGGEENGGLIFPKHQHCRDGAMTMAKMVEHLATTGLRLSALTSSLPSYHVTKTHFPCPQAQKAPLLERLRKHYAADDSLRIDTTDGLKVHYPDGAWVLIRPSGTEPIYRVFAEAREPKRSKRLAQDFVAHATDALSSIAA
jgi:phosphomannomutase / phosphoglucomutase